MFSISLSFSNVSAKDANGTTYRVTGAGSEHVNASVNGTGNLNVTVHLNVVGEGGNGVSQLTLQQHLTINANNVATVNTYSTSAVCK